MPARRHIVPPRAGRSQLRLSESELVEWGEELGRSSMPPLVITLTGELGAGKTTLAKAICRGYGVKEDITSPTYALVHQYSSERSPVFHIDLYRLDGVEQLTNLAWDDIIGTNALVLVEWPERAGDRIAPSHLPIDLSYVPDDPSRRILLAG
ncbi:MAG TPA: tRNA (adenosine(37)-N6)-threonylcarbamoyltransferase complex ATPase subunit type 1 TsaE [Gemmatimonadaceae bacterium]|nr:tRNA (adenosine(37)-N6)-threonylcarbamoyltransferase complex ATPase subunit type 1 TsaE [Gemmatimonadaceae bacterium]